MYRMSWLVVTLVVGLSIPVDVLGQETQAPSQSAEEQSAKAAQGANPFGPLADSPQKESSQPSSKKPRFPVGGFNSNVYNPPPLPTDRPETQGSSGQEMRGESNQGQFNELEPYRRGNRFYVVPTPRPPVYVPGYNPNRPLGYPLYGYPGYGYGYPRYGYGYGVLRPGIGGGSPVGGSNYFGNPHASQYFGNPHASQGR